MFQYQKYSNNVSIWSDTDYAGCIETRKSTVGTVVTLGKHTIKTSSSTQSVIALSSGEAEYYGLVRGASVGLGTQAILGDLGIKSEHPSVIVRSDAAVAIGIAMRLSLIHI